MKWVVAHLKSVLRKEQMIGSKHRPLSGDAKYKLSADFADQRIPELKKAIAILENAREIIVKPKSKKKLKSLPTQFSIWTK